MDLKVYYQKIREIEETIEGQFAVVVSLKTPDGGKAGALTEVTRFTAARLVAEQRARLATPEELGVYRKQQAEIVLQAAQDEATKRVQITLVSDADMRRLRGKSNPRKG